MSSDLSADLEDFVKDGRIKSGYCNLDLFRPIMPQNTSELSMENVDSDDFNAY